MADLYNLIWVYPAPSGIEPVHASRENLQRLNTLPSIKAIIIYPAFTTPAVLIGDQKLELLLLVSDDSKELKEEDVNRQLKISPGLDAMKPYSSQPLFSRLAKDDLEIKEILLNEDLIKTKDSDPAFTGLLDKRALKLFENALYNFKKLYRVIIKNPCRVYKIDRTVNYQINSETIANEHHDELVYTVTSRSDSNSKLLPREGKYCFEIGSKDIDFTKPPKLTEPLQTYHPVFHFKKLDYAKLGHLSDIHVNARQNVLCQSKARVIEYTDAGNKESDQGVSPEIGPMVNICSRNLKELLGKMSKREIVLLGGDLIDYIRNVYPRSTDKDMTIAGIWSRVALGEKYQENYHDFVDFTVFYTLVLDFYRTQKIPMFAISGNHDAYFEPYGISPQIIRKPLWTEWVERANDGVPADHNLTFYEAILIFGETFHVLKKESVKISPMVSVKISPMVPEKFEWFYTLFTPWADFSVKLSKQSLIGLSWGDNENLFDPPNTNHGFGHLPRSPQSISGKQMKLLESTLMFDRKVVLMSHFTFASYADKISQNSKIVGNKNLAIIGTYSGDQFSDYDYGTFEKNREAVYKDKLCKGDKIQVVLTGHSHRRGLYTLNMRKGFEGLVVPSVEIHHHDFCDLSKIKSSNHKYEPLIIVSDSAGPIPRRNQYGEFAGWGSDAPSGTQVDFDSDGQVSRIMEIKTVNKPRLAVAIDYWDIVEDKNVITEFESNIFLIRDEKLNKTEYSFSIRLHKHIYQLGIELDCVAFYCKRASSNWEKLSLTYSPSEQYRLAPGKLWLVQKSDNRLLEHFAQNKDGGLFLAIKFKTIGEKTPGEKTPTAMIHNLYDLNSYWNFVCNIKSVNFNSTSKKYVVIRDKKRAEEPNFAWRNQMKKYQ